MKQGSAPPRKKVLFVITKSNFGGAQKYVYEIATSLPSDRYEVAVALGGEGARGESGGALQKALEAAHVRVIFVHAFVRDIRARSDARAFFELAEIFRKEAPDIVHLNSSKAVATGAIAAWLEGVPRRVATIHGWAFREERPVWQRVAIALAQWFSSLFLTDIVVLHSKDALGWPSMRRKTRVIHSALRWPLFLERDAARAELLRQFSIVPPADALWFASIAELTRNKGHIFALRALARLNRTYAYLLFGAGELEAEVRSEAATLRLEKRVHFLGHVPNAAQYLRAFDAYLSPSLKEGWPYALLEAGAAGIPIAATDVGGVREMLGKGAHIVPARDTKRFVRAIEETLADARGALHIQERIEREFSHEGMLDATRALYD